MNLNELLKRAQWDKISDAELSEVVRMLLSKETEDVYTSIQILGRAGSPTYKKVVEPYLKDVGDPQLSALAVKVLCWSWGLVAEYRDVLLSFLSGVDWDVDGYVRLQTIGTVGEFLRENSDIEFLQLLYGIFSNEMERSNIRSVAYCALCRSEKMDWRDIPPAWRPVDFTTEIDTKMIDRVRQKLSRRLH